MIMSVRYCWVLDRHGRYRTLLGCDDLGRFLIICCRNKGSSHKCLPSASRILTTNECGRCHLFPQLYETVLDSSYSSKIRKDLKWKNKLKSLHYTAIESKKKEKRLCGGSEIWHKSGKIGKILGEDIDKDTEIWKMRGMSWEWLVQVWQKKQRCENH